MDHPVRKAKPGSQALSKSQKKVEKMPRIEPLGPVKEDKTIYSGKKPVVQKKKKTEEGKKNEKFIPLDTAISQMEHRELENILKVSQERFPENQDVWLKDLASFLNLQLERVKETDYTFKGKPIGYPFEIIPQGCQKVLNSVVKKYSNQTLDNLYDYCMQMMLMESSKDLSTMGYRIFLQLLAHNKPDIVLGKIHQYLELLKTHQNRPSHCLSILWAVGQCGVKNLKCGLKVWLDLMLPALEIRQAAHYSVEYLEQLLGSSRKVTAFGIVTLREYFQVLDVVFNPSFNLAGDLRKRLTVLYPQIKELAFGETPSHNLRTFFPSYLARFSLPLNQALKAELLDCLVKCLTTDKQSFSVWCQLYTKHLTASGNLLEYINHEWPKLAQQFDKKLLWETVRSFSVTNDEVEAQGRGKQGLALCQAATKELTAKINHSSFPWGQTEATASKKLVTYTTFRPMSRAASKFLPGGPDFIIICCTILLLYGVVKASGQDEKDRPSFANFKADPAIEICLVDQENKLVCGEQLIKKLIGALENQFGEMVEQIQRAFDNHDRKIGILAIFLIIWIGALHWRSDAGSHHIEPGAAHYIALDYVVIVPAVSLILYIVFNFF